MNQVQNHYQDIYIYKFLKQWRTQSVQCHMTKYEVITLYGTSALSTVFDISTDGFLFCGFTDVKHYQLTYRNNYMIFV